MDVTTSINCQVGAVFYVYPLEPCLTCDNHKLWTLFSVVSIHSYAFLLLKREHLSPCRFFSSFSVCLRSPHRYWSSSARTSSLTITQRRQFSGILFLLMLLALQFGTEIRLCWRWRSLYGSPILRSIYKVSPFPPRRKPEISYKHGLGTDVIRVNCQFFCYSSPFGPIPSVDSLCLGPCTTRLWDRQDRSHLAFFHPRNNLRHGLASLRTRRFARHAPWRWCYVWSDSRPLATGEVSVVL